MQYQKAVNIDLTKSEGHLKSGNTYVKLEKLDRAKDCYQKVLGISPESLDARTGLFFSLKGLGQSEEAIPLGKKITAAEPSNLQVHKGLRDIYIQTLKEEETIAEIKTIITLAPSEKDNYRQLAKIHVKRQEIAKALENYKRILSIDDKDKEALLQIGSLLYEKGDLDESASYLRRLGAIDTSNVTVLSYLALNDAGKGDLDNAAKTLNSIVPDYRKLGEDDRKLLSHALFVLGEKYLQVKNPTDAKSYFLKSSEVSQNPDAAEALAGIYAREGETAFQQKTFKVAASSFEQALKLDPNNGLYKDRLNEARRIRTRKQRNVVLAIAIPVLLVGLLAAAFFLYGHYSAGELIINTLSDDQVAGIQIDGKEYTLTQGRIKLNKGEHKVLVKGKPGYNDSTSTIRIEGGDKKEIAVSLDSAKNAVPASDQGNRLQAESQPPESAPVEATNEQESIRRFYLAVQNKRVGDAVNMYASEKRPKINRNLIESVAKDTEYYRFEKIETIHKDNMTAKVQVLMLHKKYKRPAEYWENTIELVKENNRWMIWSTPGKKIR